MTRWDKVISPWLFKVQYKVVGMIHNTFAIGLYNYIPFRKDICD
jgi:hypothetical protein